MRSTHNENRAWLGVLFTAFAALGTTLLPAQATATDHEGALSDAEMRRGRILFLQCRACHSLTPGDNEGKIGPSLAGVFERRAGTADYFNAYSEALKSAAHEWNPKTMDHWLTGPAAMVPGTSMVFSGITDEARRDLLVRYLQAVTRIESE